MADYAQQVAAEALKAWGVSNGVAIGDHATPMCEGEVSTTAFRAYLDSYRIAATDAQVQSMVDLVADKIANPR